MSSPIFYLKVLAKNGPTFRVQISVVESGGFDVHSKRDVLKAIGYGGDFLFPDGRVDYQWEERSVIARELDFESQLWNDDWIEANASRYVADARIVEEVNHPWPECGPRYASPETDTATGPIFTYADAERHFALREYPHCVVEITVTDPAFIGHLTSGMVYSFY